MRCCCCNSNLSDYESTLKSATTGEYLDMCKKCLKDLDIPTMKNTIDPDVPPPEEDENFWDMVEIEDTSFVLGEDEDAD